MGDDCHMRHQAATMLLMREVLPAMAEHAPRSVLPTAQMTSPNGHFALTLTIAACRAALASTLGIHGSSLVSFISRNGVDTALMLAGLPGRWFTAPAPLVVDPLYRPGFGDADAAPDIGDSALVECAGLGGAASAASPGVAAFLGGGLADALERTRMMDDICLARSERFRIPTLDGEGTPLGVDARRCLETGNTPLINTGILHRVDGGQIGAGIARVPLDRSVTRSSHSPGRSHDDVGAAPDPHHALTLRVRRAGVMVGGLDHGRVMAAGAGWAWLRGDGGVVHVTGDRGPRGPLTAIVASVPPLRVGQPVTLDLAEIGALAHAATPAAGRRLVGGGGVRGRPATRVERPSRARARSRAVAGGRRGARRARTGADPRRRRRPRRLPPRAPRPGPARRPPRRRGRAADRTRGDRRARALVAPSRGARRGIRAGREHARRAPPGRRAGDLPGNPAAGRPGRNHGPRHPHRPDPRIAGGADVISRHAGGATVA